MRRMTIFGGVLALAIGMIGCGVVDGDEVLAERQPAGATGGGAGGSGGIPTYDAVVRPILLEYCGECHDSANKTGGVDVTSYDALLAGQGIVVAGDADASKLVTVIESGAMPPPGRDRPDAKQVATIRAWVQGGALK